MYLERDDHVDETEEGKKLKEKLLAGEAAQAAKLEAEKLVETCDKRLKHQLIRCAKNVISFSW